MVWLEFLICVAIILFAGTKLARYGDAIAEKTGLGRIWIGLVLVAAITTMPELVTGVSSAALVKLPDLALGTLLGSCLFNLTILALLDILHRPSPVLSQASPRHIASAGMGILLIAIAAGTILAGERFSGLSLGWVGISSIIILVVYLVGARQLFLFEQRNQPPPAPHRYDGLPAGTVYFRFALASAAIIGAGIWLSFVGDEIATTTGWNASFVGSLFLAITTSLPELVVALAALRLGAIDMAVANILGANILDIVIIVLADLAYTQGPILAAVSRVHFITAAVAMVMSLLVILGLRFQLRRKTFFVISWYGVILIGLYIFGAYALFTAGIGLG
ncbi:MAG: sodium:calcium antiporter [Dehalococcoidia bacterium]|nr:MAG: sodium:calcium antiporter [Dehalococcoidia bacterium]